MGLADERLGLSEIAAIEAAAKRLSSRAELLRKLFSVLLVATCALYLMAFLAMLLTGVKDYSTNNSISVCIALAKIALETATAVFLVWVLRAIFRDISEGASPFSLRQANRLRIAAVLWLIHAVLTAVISPAFLTALGLGDAAVGATVGMTPSEANMRFIPINAGDIVLAIVLFCAALIVEYGSLLQKLSDDTL